MIIPFLVDGGDDTEELGLLLLLGEACTGKAKYLVVRERVSE